MKNSGLFYYRTLQIKLISAHDWQISTYNFMQAVQRIPLHDLTLHVIQHFRYLQRFNVHAGRGLYFLKRRESVHSFALRNCVLSTVWFCCYQWMSRSSILALPAICNSVKWPTWDVNWNLKSGTYLWLLEFGQSISLWKSLLVNKGSQWSSVLVGKCHPGLQRLPPSLSETCERGVLPQEPGVRSAHLTACSSDTSLPVSSLFQRKHEMRGFPTLQLSGRTSFPALPKCLSRLHS